MTIAEILEQAKILSLLEHRELAKLLIDTLDSDASLMKSRSKTDAEIVAILNEMPAIEFVDPRIDDLVEWIKAQRRKRLDKLQTYQDGEE